ncbi:MAG: hypothetical protein COB67_10730 [SAR324 cluster bacterium]|uniref:SPOR domain-containing protein n=1 Tax=SAR324 cluster bacterium TaxID=2024889 RepID=A0A2A4SX11_9DELT|nr:MAG: hypothetical protein COB67_10730 [SAR324 cluster bacterium]
MAKKAKQTKSTGSKKKGFFILILLLSLLIGGAAYYWYFSPGMLFEAEDSELMMEAPLTSLQVEPEASEDLSPNQGVVRTFLEEQADPLPEPPKPVKKTRRKQTKYYVKVGTCLFVECQVQYSQLIETKKMPIFKTSAVKVTKYYELISSSSYSLERAREKRALLLKYNKRLSPYLVPHKKGYRISFGSFPVEGKGVEMKSYLAQLYPQINMVFALEPRKDRYKVITFHAGPFSSQAKAQQAKIQLRKLPEFMEAKVITRK